MADSAAKYIQVDGKINIAHSTQFSEPISDMMTPVLAPANINHFYHVRLFADGSHFAIGNNAALAEYIYTSDCFKKSQSFQNNLFHCETKDVLWPNQVECESDRKHFASIGEKFNIHHGITTVMRTRKYIDFFHFGAPKAFTQAQDYMVTHHDFINTAVFYYKDRAQKIIDKASQQKVYEPEYHLNINECINTYHDAFNVPDLQKSIMSKIKRYYIDDTYLTAKELETVLALSQGQSAKQIAYAQGISQRTIEAHIYQAKYKLRCKKNAELILKVAAMGLIPHIQKI